MIKNLSAAKKEGRGRILSYIFLQRRNMYHIIYNPVAGKKKALKNLRKVEEILTARKLSYQLHETQAVRDSERIARELTEKGEYDLIVLGGDGTLHEVLNGIVDPTQCRLGIIPSGTGNDFADRLGLPKKVDKALELIINGVAKDTDYLQIGAVRCMNVAGLGMDVDVLERCQRGKMKGKLKYLVSLLKSLFAFKGYPIAIEREGKMERKDALIAAACNGSKFGGGIPICPDAMVDDGKINVVVVDCIPSKIKLIHALTVLLRGKILKYRLTKTFLCERVRFAPDTPCTVQLDGELYTDLDLDIEIKTGLKIYRE